MANRADLRSKIDSDLDTLANRVNELEDLAGGVRETIRESLSLDHHVEERPWTCMGIAFASGLLLGRLIS